MTNPDAQKIIDWYGKHGASIDALIAGHRDYTEASRRIGTEPVLDTLRACQAAMERFVTMIDRNQMLPRFGVAAVDKHYQSALDLYRQAGEDFQEISASDTPESITRQILAAGDVLARGTDALNETTRTIASLGNP